MTYASTDPVALLADKWWRRRHSAWLLAVILGVGAFSFIGFVYTAFRVRSKKFWIIAAVSSAVSALAIVALETMPRADPDGTVQGGDWQTMGIVAIWIGMIIFGVYHNRDYLRWRADPVKPRQWYEQQPVAAPGLAPAPDLVQGIRSQMPNPTQPLYAPETAPGLGVDTTQFYAPAPASQPPYVGVPRTHAGVPSQPAPPPCAATAPLGPVDVNNVTAQQLSVALRGDSSLAGKIVTARDERGGFADLDDLVSAARLQPHELMKVRGNISFGPRRTQTPQPGATPQSPPTQGPPDDGGYGRGRILDF